MSYATFRAAGAASLDVLSARGVLPLRGAWAWEAEIDAANIETPAKGARAELSIGGRTFAGYVRDVAPWQGRVRLLLEAGAAGMRTELEAQGFESALLSTLVARAVLDAGEALAAELEPGAVLERWTRPAGTGAAALTAIAEAAGLGWRFTDAGAVLVAAEAWPAADESGVLELQPDGADASAEVAPLAATLDPGTTWRGRRIERVAYVLPEGQSLTARLVFERSEAPGEMKGLFERAVRAALRELGHAKRWPATVEAQTEDGRLALVPDDATMPGTPPVPVLYGLPGCRAVVAQGARVGLVHDGADAARPRAEGWEQATPARELHLDASELVALAGGGPAVHRVGDGGSAGTLVAAGTPITYVRPNGEFGFQITASAGATPVLFTIVPIGTFPPGEIVTKALEGSGIVKAGG